MKNLLQSDLHVDYELKINTHPSICIIHQMLVVREAAEDISHQNMLDINVKWDTSQCKRSCSQNLHRAMLASSIV